MKVCGNYRHNKTFIKLFSLMRIIACGCSKTYMIVLGPPSPDPQFYFWGDGQKKSDVPTDILCQWLASLLQTSHSA